MSRVLITPIGCDVEPFELQGDLTSKVVDGEQYYYIAGQSFNANIVTILEEE